MVQTMFNYPATLEPDEDGRPVVTFPDLPGAVTDGADQAEALREAVDCLSEALATRITHGEEIPPASPAAPGQHLVAPDPTIALKTALYQQLREHGMTVADLADQLGLNDWHQAARLIDPRRSSKLTSLAEALGALGCRIAISIEASEPPPFDPLAYTERDIYAYAERHGLKTTRLRVSKGAASLSEATLHAVQAHGRGATPGEVAAYLAREFGMNARPNQIGLALQRHRRAGRLTENPDHRWVVPATTEP
jgi:antitoxin HicB